MNYIYVSDTQDSFSYPDRFIYLTYDGDRMVLYSKNVGNQFFKTNINFQS